MIHKNYQTPETRIAILPYVSPLCLSPDTAATDPVTEQDYDFGWDD